LKGVNTAAMIGQEDNEEEKVAHVEPIDEARKPKI
jgi:hypothetical protein